MNGQVLSVVDVLAALDSWNGGKSGPAYGKVVLYAAEKASFEELVRAVLLDRGIDPEHWRSHAAIVSEGFEEWMQIGRAV